MTIPPQLSALSYARSVTSVESQIQISWSLISLGSNTEINYKVWIAKGASLPQSFEEGRGEVTSPYIDTYHFYNLDPDTTYTIYIEVIGNITTEPVRSNSITVITNPVEITLKLNDNVITNRATDTVHNILLNMGGNYTLSVDATAVPGSSIPRNYRWYHNEYSLDSVTTPSYTLSNIDSTKAGLYRVGVEYDSSVYVLVNNLYFNIQIATPPVAPVVTAIPNTNVSGRIDLSWVGVDSTDTYSVSAISDGGAAGSFVVDGTTASFTGLTIGVEYTFTVVATNTNGLTSSASVSATIPAASLPGAPTDLTFTSQDTAISVSGTNPTDTGAGANSIVSYRVRVYSDANGATELSIKMTESSSLPVTVAGLSDDVDYYFSMAVKNDVMEEYGPESAISAAQRTVTSPTMPSDVTVTAGYNSIIVGWYPPVTNFGNTSFTYKVRIYGGAIIDVPADTLPNLETGKYQFIIDSSNFSSITAGTPYDIGVCAIGNIDENPSDFSESKLVHPFAEPGAPLLSASPHAAGGRVDLIWRPGNSNASGMHSTEPYSVSVTGGAANTPSISGTTASVTGLTNGVVYTFTVTAKNAAGLTSTSNSVSAGPSIPPETTPDAPSNLRLTTDSIASTTVIDLSWTAGASDGGATTTYTLIYNTSIVDINVNPDGATTIAGITTASLTVGSLIAGTRYYFQVKAVNDVGSSLYTSPAFLAVTLPAAPIMGIPSRVTGSSTEISVAFNPVTGTRPIANYTVIVYNNSGAPTGHTALGTASPINVSNLTPGSTYKFKVKAATLDAGNLQYSDESEFSTPIVPAKLPGAPTDLTFTSQDTAISVSGTNPTDTGAGANSIVSYRVKVYSDATGNTELSTKMTESSSLPVTVSNLSSGVDYYFSMAVKNDIMTEYGPESVISSAQRIVSTGAPQNVLITHIQHYGYFDVNWNEPIEKGGNTTFTYQVRIEGKPDINIAATTYRIFGLISSVEPYNISVRAIGNIDNTPGLFSTPQPIDVPYGEPSKPVFTATPKITKIKFNWSTSAPATYDGTPTQLYKLHKSDDGGSTYTIINDNITMLPYTHSNLLPGTSYKFKISAHNMLNLSRFSDVIQVSTLADVPFITSQPVGGIITGNNSLTLSVDFIGSSCRWYKDGEIISDATNRSYTARSAGSYKARVFATSGTGYTDSNDAIITPHNFELIGYLNTKNINIGETFTLTYLNFFNFDDTPDIVNTYLFYKGIAIADNLLQDSSSKSFTTQLTEATSAQGQLYTVVRKTGIFLNPLTINIIAGIAAPVITSQPVVNNSLTLSVGATGESLTYQWYKDGEIIEDAGTGLSYIASGAGNYKVRVTSAGGRYTDSNYVTMFINPLTGGGEAIVLSSLPQYDASNKTAISGASGTPTLANFASVPNPSNTSYPSQNLPTTRGIVFSLPSDNTAANTALERAIVATVPATPNDPPGIILIDNPSRVMYSYRLPKSSVSAVDTTDPNSGKIEADLTNINTASPFGIMIGLKTSVDATGKLKDNISIKAVDNNHNTIPLPTYPIPLVATYPISRVTKPNPAVGIYDKLTVTHTETNTTIIFTLDSAKTTDTIAVYTGVLNHNFDNEVTPPSDSTPSPELAPDAPVLTATTTDNTSITLNWTAPVSNDGNPIQEYKLHKSDNGGSTYTIIPNIMTPYTVYNLLANTSYKFKVSAHNTSGLSTFSNEFTLDAAPVITLQPVGGTITIGSSLTLSVGYTGGSLEWYKDGDLLVGDTSNSYSANSAGSYKVRVLAPSGRYTDSNTVTVSNSPPTPAICFLGNTPIQTPTGYRRIDRLRVGDKVMTADGRTVAIQRIFKKNYEPSVAVNPYVIPKGQFGATENVMISPEHRVAVSGRGLVEARKLGLKQMSMRAAFDYYNLELPTWESDNMVAAGVEVESLAPVRRLEITKAEFTALLKAKYGRITPDVIAKACRTCFMTADGKVNIPTLKRKNDSTHH
jgi:hypothetical protein